MSALNKPDDHSLSQQPAQAGSVSPSPATPLPSEKMPTNMAILSQLDAAFSQLDTKTSKGGKGLGASSSQAQLTAMNPNLRGQGSSQAGSQNPQGSGNATTNMQLAMAELAGAMSGLEQVLLNYQANTSSMQAQIGTQLIQNAQSSLKTAQSDYQTELADIQKENQEAHKHKLFGAIFAVIGFIASAFMGPEMLVMTLAMTAMTVGGPNSGMSKMTGAIAHAIESDPHISASTAKVLADVVSCMVVMSAALVTGSFGTAAKEMGKVGDEVGAKAVKAAVKAAKKGGEDAGENAAEGAGEGTAEGAGSAPSEVRSAEATTETEHLTQQVSKEGDKLDKSVRDARSSFEKLMGNFKNMKNGKAFTAMFGIQAGLQTGLPGDIAKAAGANAEVIAIVNAAAAVAGMIGMVVAGCCMGPSSGGSDLSKALSPAARKVFSEQAIALGNKIGDMLSSPQFQTWGNGVLNFLQGTGLILQAGVSLRQYFTYSNQSDAQIATATADAATTFFQAIDKMDSSLNQQLMSSLSSAVSDVGEQINTVTQTFVKANQGELDVMSENA